uniref:Heparan-sulfate 6-O-sulfotransferase n=1 Tax=Sarcophilus harrisii TaxID=9305 RepID=G3WCR7_SARHA
ESRTMDERFNKWLLTPVLTLLFLIIMYQYVSPTCTNSCTNFGDKFQLEEEEEEQDRESPDNGSLPKFVPRFNFSVKDLTRFVDFNIKGRDVIVFLHIQKTGGTTFGRHLVKNIRLEQPCSCKPGQKKCTCHRPGKKETWLFSRFSTGWSCGLHADWTELTNCVPAIMEKKDCPRNHSRTRYGHSFSDTFLFSTQ